MRKQRAPEKLPLTFKEYLDNFDPKVLEGAVSQLDGSIAWQLMQAYLKLKQREFEVAALDLVKHDNQVQAAAHASGYAQACEDIANSFLQTLSYVIAGKDGLVEGPAREVEN